MSSKMNQIPFLSSYEDVRAEMNRDLQYRLNSRTAQTSLGRPLYYRINVQMITTQECPFHCPFCLERQNPMSGDNDAGFIRTPRCQIVNHWRRAGFVS